MIHYWFWYCLLILFCLEKCPFILTNWSQYKHDELICTSKQKDRNKPFYVTSGQLWCKNNRGFIDTYNFRMLINVFDNYKLIRYNDSTIVIDFAIVRWHTIQSTPNWSGIHLFSRYQTEDDLYVASIRVDGLSTIKKKIKGEYTTLQQSHIQQIQLQQNYRLHFSVCDNTLSLLLNNVMIMQYIDTDLQSGCCGVRTDYCDVVLNTIEIN